MKSIVSAAAVGILLTGCASVVSHKVPNGNHAQAGVSYYLPKRMVRATFERVKLVEDPASKLEAARETLAASERAAATAQAHLAQTAARLKSLKDAGVEPTAPVFLGAIGENVDASLKMDAARAAVTEARRKRDALDVADLEWRIYRNDCGFVDRFSVTVLPPIPDLAHAYVLEPRHSPTRTENFQIKTTPSGLLSTVQGSIEDQSAAIVVALVQGATALQTPQTGAAVTDKKGDLEKAAAEECKGWKPRKLEAVIDPVSGWETFFESVNVDSISCEGKCPPRYRPRVNSDEQTLAGAQEKKVGSGKSPPACEVPVPSFTSRPPAKPSPGQEAKLDVPETQQAQNVDASEAEEKAKTAQEREHSTDPLNVGSGNDGVTPGSIGIFYRRELPSWVTIEKCEGGHWLPTGSFLLALPNDAPAERLPMHASPFVATQYDIGFDQGLLVSVDSNRPSEALRIASLPWEVAQATMNVLTSLIRFRVDYTKSDVDLLSQQIEQIKQQQALLEARQRAEPPSGNVIGSATPDL